MQRCKAAVRTMSRVYCYAAAAIAAGPPASGTLARAASSAAASAAFSALRGESSKGGGIHVRADGHRILRRGTRRLVALV